DVSYAFLARCTQPRSAGDSPPRTITDNPESSKLLIPRMGKTTGADQLTPADFARFPNWLAGRIAVGEQVEFFQFSQAENPNDRPSHLDRIERRKSRAKTARHNRESVHKPHGVIGPLVKKVGGYTARFENGDIPAVLIPRGRTYQS
ncbi:MAG: hypothetical protein AB7Q45_10605, partial [Planctomycetaceae bacterium]